MANSPIIYGGTSSQGITLLPPGSTGYLRSDSSGNLSYATAPTTITYNIQSKTSAYTAVANDYVIASGASFVITLPTAVGISGQQICIQHNGTSLTQLYTLNTTSGQTIRGIASGAYVLYTNGETLNLVSDGSNWQILSHVATTTWATYTPTFVGAGTVTGSNIFWRRNGSDMLLSGGFNTGTVNGSTGSMSLPGSMTVSPILSTYSGANQYVVGQLINGLNTSALTLTALALNGNSVLNFSILGYSGATPASPQAGTLLWGNTTFYNLSNISVPISGWQP